MTLSRIAWPENWRHRRTWRSVCDNRRSCTLQSKIWKNTWDSYGIKNNCHTNYYTHMHTIFHIP